MHYLVYQITNLINGKTYIGAHKTEDLDDGYMGSGKIITRALSKYGGENFVKTILFEAESSEKMFEKEAELVILGPHSYNLKKGGEGGFDYIHKNHLNSFDHVNKLPKEDRPNLIRIKEMVKNGEVTWGGTSNWTEESRRKVLEQVRINLKDVSRKKKELWETEPERRTRACQRISESVRGEGNSQYGRFWISNTETKEVKRIERNESIPEGWVRGKSGRIVKTCWINDGVSETTIRVDLINDFRDRGFSRGRLKSSISNLSQYKE